MQVSQLNSNVFDNILNWRDSIPILRETNFDADLAIKVTRMFCAIGDVPFGTSRDNDWLRVSYWYAHDGESFAYVVALNLRANEVKYNRFYHNVGWQGWFN